MRRAQIFVRTRACSRTFIARTKQAALTHNVRVKELKRVNGVTIARLSRDFRTNNDVAGNIASTLTCSADPLSWIRSRCWLITSRNDNDGYIIPNASVNWSIY